MTYTLKDFDLKPGDWVKDAQAGIWCELEESWHPDSKVSAVRRPSIIIREKLDQLLEEARKHGGYKESVGHWISFTEIKPRKEEKKSLLEEATELAYSEGIKPGPIAKLLCDQIEALKKKLEAFCEQSK